MRYVIASGGVDRSIDRRDFGGSRSRMVCTHIYRDAAGFKGNLCLLRISSALSFIPPFSCEIYALAPARLVGELGIFFELAGMQARASRCTRARAYMPRDGGQTFLILELGCLCVCALAIRLGIFCLAKSF